VVALSSPGGVDLGADREGAQRRREQRQLRLADGRLGGGVPVLLGSALAFVGALMQGPMLVEDRWEKRG
jgi:hypothetical protein